MAIYLRPRRGRKTTAESQNIILKRGEIFFEYPEGGPGTGIGRIKMGDGSLTYKNLPYFLDPSDMANSAITFSTNSSNDNNTLLNTITSGAKLNVIIGAIKKLLSNLNSAVSSFQNGVDTIFNGCKTYGSTPSASTPSAIVTAIKNIYDNRYTAGVNSCGPKRANGTSVSSTGVDSTGPWAYFPYGVYPNYNNSGNSYIYFTKDQVKQMAEQAGVMGSGLNIYCKSLSISDGSWNGVTLKNDEWVSLCNQNKNSKWTYNFPDITLDVDKIEFLSFHMSDWSNYFRIGRGVDVNGNSLYHHFATMEVSGFKSYSSTNTPGISTVNTSSGKHVHSFKLIDNYSRNNNNSENAQLSVDIYSNKLEFNIEYLGRSFGQCRTTTPEFFFVIGYKN